MTVPTITTQMIHDQQWAIYQALIAKRVVAAATQRGWRQKNIEHANTSRRAAYAAKRAGRE